MFYPSQLNKGFYSHAREISYTDLEKLDTTEKVVKYLNENLPKVAPQNAPFRYEPKQLFETGELYSVYEYKIHHTETLGSIQS